MPVIIDLPQNRLDKIKLADWMELNALLDDTDHSVSIEDLASVSKIENSDDDTKIEETKTNVSAELLSRQNEIKTGYPFKFNGKLLEVKKNLKPSTAYIFCLLISYIGLDRGAKKLKSWKTHEVAEVFENISTHAAKNFFSNKTEEANFLQFGAPRSSWKKEERPFKKALEILKTKLNEGSINPVPTTSRRQDAGLDVIVWRTFPDNRTNKFFFLAQCAAGNDYKSKKRQLMDFKQYYSISVGVMHGFFIPHEIDENDWSDLYHEEVGIMFDRSRISWYAQDWKDAKIEGRINFILKKLKKYKKAL